MVEMQQRLEAVRQQIEDAAKGANRPPNSVQLLAVSKRHRVEKIRDAYALGQRLFGENYLQEALEKQEQLKDLAIDWHFIGPIQSNKTRLIAENFSWVHSVDRLKIAERLSASRPSHLEPLNICLQVNLDVEASKSGVLLEEVPHFVRQIEGLPGIHLRGLMAIPAIQSDPEQQRATFERLASCLKQLQRDYPKLDTLSMGMSADLNAAITAGSTIVRIGTAIFGERSV